MKELSVISKEIKPSLTRKLFNMAKAYDDVIDFTLGDPDIQPHENIKEAAFDAIKKGKTRYSQNAGLMELREVISARYNEEYGINYNPVSEIIVTVGGMEGLYLALLSTLNNGDEVIIPAPYWINYGQMVQMCGAKPVLVNSKSADDLSVSVDNIEKAITDKTKVLIINSPSNPSGLVIPKEDIKKIADLAIKYDLYVIADEVYRRMIYEGQEYFSISNIKGMKERTILVNSLSKEFCMTGWRLGYVATNSNIIAVMTMLQENVAACAPLPSQYAAIEAILHRDIYVTPMIDEYSKRRSVLIEELSKIPNISFKAPDATFYAMINIKATKLSSEEFAYKLLESEHVAVVPGITYGLCCEGFVRIAFTVNSDLIKEGIKRLHRFMQNFV